MPSEILCCNVPHRPVFQYYVKLTRLLKGLAANKMSYSKSHARRLKRKAKEEIGGGWSDMQLAIATVDQSCSFDERQSSTMDGTLSDEQPRVPVKSSRISEGKSSTLSGSQRRNALYVCHYFFASVLLSVFRELEKNRHPLILSDPNFVSDPFHAIRTHAQNTLVKRQIPTSM